MRQLEEQATLNDINRSYRNRDHLKRLNYPRATYAFSGIDFGDAPTEFRTRGKLDINGAPMVITPLPPGASASNDASWSQTYGASMDCLMSLIDGNTYNDNILDTLGKYDSPYQRALPLAENSNLYDPIGGKQQIHFIAGKPDVPTFRAEADQAIQTFEARSLGTRAPVQMCGWGKTIGMRPTDPNPADKRVNDDAHKFDRSTWKVGPLDARWDENRKMWRAFNDLIADNQNKGLGTFVFSTNPNEQCGFPFLRAKLDDVWEVRRTFREDGTTTASRNDDTTKSALLVTKLDGYALQNNKIASWNEVLIIFDECFSGFEATCGTEKTKEAQMAISTAANFYANKTAVGPISFSQNPDAIIPGSMYYLGDGPCGSWVPALKKDDIDICDLGATEFGRVSTSDKNLQTAIISLCDFTKVVTKRNKDYVFADVLIDIEDAKNAKEVAIDSMKGFETVQEWADMIVDELQAEIFFQVSASVIGLGTAVQGAMNDLGSEILSRVSDAFVAFAAALAAACECIVAAPELDSNFNVILPMVAGPPSPFSRLDLSTSIGNLDVDAVKFDGIVTSYEELGKDIELASEEDQFNLSVTVIDPCSGVNTTEDC